MSILNKLQIVEKYIIKDLIELEKNEDGIFSQLFIDRDGEIDRFVSFINMFKNDGLNLLISAEAGVGKTHYIANLMLNGQLHREDMYYLNLDYGALKNQSQNSLMMEFIDEMLKYFKEINEPLNSTTNIHENIKENLREVLSHFDYCKEKDNSTKHLVIILDDLDYVEEELWQSIAGDFIAYAKSTFCSLVVSCRPPLEAALKTDPRTKKHLCSAPYAKTIELPSLDITNIVISRLSYIYNNSNSLIKKVMKISLNINGNVTQDNLPFDKVHLNFIRMFSNGNVREMMYMFRKNLSYVIDNRKQFNMLQNGKIDFTRENILKLYYDNADVDCCKIININEQTSRKTGNSLYYNLLIAIADRQIIDEDLMDLLTEDLKFKRGDIINAILLLSNNQHRILHPISIGPEDKKIAIDIKIYRSYVLSARGEAYITNLKSWDCYLSRVGSMRNDYESFIQSLDCQ